MLVWRERLQAVPVMSLQTGARLATTSEPILDPHDLHIEAFFCDGPMVDFKPAVLHTNDIREYGELGMIINDSDDIMPLDDLVRLQELIDYRFHLIDMKVIDTAKHKLGKVNNYVVDTNTFQIMKFSVKRPLLHSFQDSELIIDRKQIRKITNTEIIVSRPDSEEKAHVRDDFRAVTAMENPFRSQRPVENMERR